MMEKKKMTRVIGTGVILIFVVAALGCADLFSTQTIREREAAMEQTISTTYRFEDIPLPAGMVFNRKESFIYETRATKTGLLVYEGRGEMDKLANFFKQQMPNHKWGLVSNFELHNVMLTFIKEGWTSIIYIIPQGEEKKRIEIRVGPIDIKLLPSS